ncbi:MAG: 4-hydroxythreonine-4-phosphate dehydrogenase PdxA [Tepidisphaeraceae bacterium]
MNPHLPILAISMGDPAGIGPEIIVKALARADVRALGRPIVVGDAGVMRHAARFAPSIRIHAIERPQDATFEAGSIDVLDQHSVDLAKLELGKVSAMAGNAAFLAVRGIIDLASAGHAHATVTAPIHKEALHLAGHHFPGHTEIFAKYTGTADFTMMLAEGNFRVVHVSTHVSLRQACDAVTKDRVLKVIHLAHDACTRLGIARPHIGVAGLNPHASDNGLFGSEEREHIAPAIEAARAQGIDVDGPHPADTFFPKCAGGGFDIGVAMYHDQGHIPLKMRGFTYDGASKAWTGVRGINVSLGLPMVRTSVDHGTGFDQAGKGTASEQSMIDAIAYAARLAKPREDSKA